MRLLTLLALVLFAALPLARTAEKPIEVRVLVLNYDPIIPGNLVNPDAPAEPGIRLHQAGKWNDPRKLTEGYIADLEKATNGFIKHRIVEWRDLDIFPTKVDGFAYTPETFMSAKRKKTEWHKPDGLDYPRALADQKVTDLIDKDVIDEVWLFGAPYFGYWEASMAGPGAFYINGGVYDKVPAKRPFAVMGFNYERGVAEMLHSMCHRVEATMSRFSGGWKTDRLDTDWARFAANAHQSNGHAGCGTCHYPPNGEKDYDYGNPRFVDSTADDWLNWPNLTGRTTRVNRDSWGGPDYHRNYMVWWYTRFPRAEGTDPNTGRLRNWWRYVYEFPRYADHLPPKKR